MTYLLWQGTAKQSPDQILTEACERYQERYGCMPTVALVPHATAPLEAPGLTVYNVRRIAPGTVQVGREETP